MTDLETVDLGGLLDSADLICERVTFGSGSAAFDVDIRHVDTRLLHEIGKKSTNVVKVNGRAETKADLPKFRQLLRDHCVAGWEGLTVGKLFTACSRTPAAGQEGLDAVVAYTPANVLLLLERARGNVGGDVIGFDDFVFAQATRIGGEQAAAEAAAKND